MFGNLFRRRGTNATPTAAPAPGAVNQKPDASSAPVAPGTSIHYHADLIGKLTSDHRALLDLFGRIKLAHGSGQLEEAAALLVRFRTALQDHLLVESVRLYVYLEHRMRDDPDSHRLIHDFRHEMDGIGKAAMAFLGKYARLAQDPQLNDSFGPELDAVGRVLVERIQREETVLYPLYEPA